MSALGMPSLPAAQGQPHPEERSEAERLEGSQQARCALPPFETLAALAPQGEVYTEAGAYERRTPSGRVRQ
jgi:hypothetical protein